MRRRPSAARRAGWLSSAAPSWGCSRSSPMTSATWRCRCSTRTRSWQVGRRPSLQVRAVALPSRGRFSASGFLPDVRRYGVTYFNYVGKPLSYILATPEHPDDRETTLQTGVRKRGRAQADVGRFSERFGVPVVDGYGSTEGGAAMSRTPDAPYGSLGMGINVIIVDQTTGVGVSAGHVRRERRRSRTPSRRSERSSRPPVRPASRATGGTRKPRRPASETDGTGPATSDTCDEAGYLYFAGRTDDWLRVDGENFAAAPVDTDSRAPSRRRARCGLRGSRSGHGRPGDGRALQAEEGGVIRPRCDSRRSSRSSRISVRSGRPVRQDLSGDPDDGDLEDRGPEPSRRRD